jgi:hypothetical protein
MIAYSYYLAMIAAASSGGCRIASSSWTSTSYSSAAYCHRHNVWGGIGGGILVPRRGDAMIDVGNGRMIRRRGSMAHRPRIAARADGGEGDGDVDVNDERARRDADGGGGGRARLARARASLISKRREDRTTGGGTSSSSADSKKASSSSSSSSTSSSSRDLIDLTRKIDMKILSNDWDRSGMRQRRRGGGRGGYADVSNEPPPVRHDDSMQSLLGYNEVGGEWSDRNSTTYHVAVVLGKALIRDQVTIEYASRMRTLVRMMEEDDAPLPRYVPRLICFTNGCGTGTGTGTVAAGGGTSSAAVSDATAGYVYFRHLCASRNVTIDESRTQFWVDDDPSRGNGGGGGGGGGDDERSAMERVASELWRRHIKTWLKDRPLTQRLNQHYGVGWTVLERKVDIHFTLISTDYHLCNLNDVHHRSPRKSLLQPLVALRGLVGSDRWVNKDEALEVMDPGYSSSVHVVRNGGNGGSAATSTSSAMQGGNTFGGIENSVDTSWSFQYATYPFLHEEEDALVFLGQCYLLGEELTPLLVNMRGVVERTEFFQRDNYLLLSSIRRSLVSLVEAL